MSISPPRQESTLCPYVLGEVMAPRPQFPVALKIFHPSCSILATGGAKTEQMSLPLTSLGDKQALQASSLIVSACL